MAKIFYYDSAGISDAIITAGTFSAPTFTASSGAITQKYQNLFLIFLELNFQYL